MFVGATLAGVALQQAPGMTASLAGAYQMVFGFVGVIGLLSLVVAWRLRR